MGALRRLASLFGRAGIATGLIIAAFAIFLGSFPQKDLDWEGTILPLARQYGGGDVSEDTTASTSSASFAQRPLQGKVIVITGCTSGIGLSLTRALSKLGATIVGIGRSEQRLARLQRELPNVTPVRADLTDLSSVQQGANEILQKFDRIDMLINNAGMYDSVNNLLGRAVSAQGYDRVFAVNYLSHFLLTEKLAPRLSRATKPTVLQISSTTHWSVDGSDLRAAAATTAATTTTTTSETFGSHAMTTTMPVAARQGGSRGLIVFRSWRSYANSKLAQIYYARAWRQTNPDSNIRFVSACPGWVGTHIAGGGGFFHSIMQAGFDVNGFGIASPLVALLDYNAGNSNDNKSSSIIHDNESSSEPTALVDYYTNSRFFDIINLAFGDKPPHALFYKSTLRDAVAFIYGMLAIALQRIGMEAAPAISSPESYNMTIAKELYDWSYQAVKEFL